MEGTGDGKLSLVCAVAGARGGRFRVGIRPDDRVSELRRVLHAECASAMGDVDLDAIALYSPEADASFSEDGLVTHIGALPLDMDAEVREYFPGVPGPHDVHILVEAVPREEPGSSGATHEEETKSEEEAAYLALAWSGATGVFPDRPFATTEFDDVARELYLAEFRSSHASAMEEAQKNNFRTLTSLAFMQGGNPDKDVARSFVLRSLCHKWFSLVGTRILRFRSLMGQLDVNIAIPRSLDVVEFDQVADVALSLDELKYCRPKGGCLPGVDALLMTPDGPCFCLQFAFAGSLNVGTANTAIQSIVDHVGPSSIKMVFVTTGTAGAALVKQELANEAIDQFVYAIDAFLEDRELLDEVLDTYD